MAKNQHTQRKLLYFMNTMNYGSSKSAKIVLTKSIFNVKNQPIFFQKKISFENINLGDHFLLKTLFSSFNLWTTLFTKIMPNFWRTVIHQRVFFPSSMLILGQKSIYVIKGNHYILRIRGVPVRQKLGMILENKVVQKLKSEKNVL